MQQTEKDNNMETIYFFSASFSALYLGITIALSLIILILVLFPLGISASSDIVFGLLAMTCFILTDIIFRKIFKKVMFISKTIQYSVLFILIPLCLYIVFFGLDTK